MTGGGREGLSVSCLRFGLQPGPGWPPPALPFREMHKKEGDCMAASGSAVPGRADVHKKKSRSSFEAGSLVYTGIFLLRNIHLFFKNIQLYSDTGCPPGVSERSQKQRPFLLRSAGVKAEDIQSDEKQTNQSGADGLLCLSDQRYIFHQGITALFQIEIYIVLTFELIIKDLSKFYEIKSSVSDEKFPDNRSCAGSNVYLDMMIGCIFHNIKHFSTSFLNHEVL